MSVKRAWREYKRNGTLDARNQLLLHYAPLVKFAVGRLRSSVPPHFENADLISYGVFGLADAIEKFDPTLGVKFETYASSRIMGAVRDELRAIDWVPRSVRSQAAAIERAQETLEGELHRTPDQGEIAAALGTSEDALHRARSRITRGNVIALDQLRVLDDGASSSSLAETITDPAQDTSEFEVHDDRHMISEVLKHLPDRERLVMRRYYFDGLTLAEIADSLGVTESRICQIHTKALRRLREHARSWGLVDEGWMAVGMSA
jgi:RNA polymerase sigma factor for flagellar operon FliA